MPDAADQRGLLRRWFPLPTEADEPDRLLEALEVTGQIPDGAFVGFAQALGRLRRQIILDAMSRVDPTPTAASGQLTRAAGLIETGLEAIRAGGTAPRLTMPEIIREALIEDLEVGQPDVDGDALLDEAIEQIAGFCELLRRVEVEVTRRQVEAAPHLAGTDRPPAEIIDALFDLASLLGKSRRGIAVRRFVAAYARLLGYRAPGDNALRHRQRAVI